jgi:hypothetical protein
MGNVGFVSFLPEQLPLFARYQLLQPKKSSGSKYPLRRLVRVKWCHDTVDSHLGNIRIESGLLILLSQDEKL